MNRKVKIYIKNINDTVYLAKRFSYFLKKYHSLFLYFDGGLGVGKSFFCKYLIKFLGFDGYITSPSFTIVNKYQCKYFDIFHFDFYRINSLHDLYDIDLHEYFNYENLFLIEWSENVIDFLPISDLHFFFSLYGVSKRIILIKSFTDLGNKILNLLGF